LTYIKQSKSSGPAYHAKASITRSIAGGLLHLPFGSDQGRRWLEIPGWKPSRRKRGTVLTHRSGEWPKNITIRILLSVKILVEFGPQCPGSIHYSVCGEKAYLADWVAGKRGGCSMSSWDEEMFTMMSGLAAVAVFCIAALLWLV